MDKVKEQIKTKREWHETQMQACQATPKHETPPVTCAQIRAEAMVSIISFTRWNENVFNHLVPESGLGL